jgi:hypothetical protein
MRRIFIFIISLFAATAAFGQVRCDAGDINIEMTYKRTVINGDEAIIDFTLTNYSKKDIKIDMDSERSRAYDDEGNCYLAHRFSFDMANTGTDGCILPPETPVRLRCFIKDIDEYATVFTRLEMSYFMNCYNYFSTSALKKMSVKNIEFTRD